MKEDFSIRKKAKKGREFLQRGRKRVSEIRQPAGGKDRLAHEKTRKPGERTH